MNSSAPIVIYISSGEEDEGDCVILDGDPDAVTEVKDGNGGEGGGDEDLVIVGEKGPIACRDFPHSRHLCANFPFTTTPHVEYCNMCHCYVCDSPAPCVNWGKGSLSLDHCHATDKDETWKNLRSYYNKIPKTTILQNSTPIPAQVSVPLPTQPSSSNPARSCQASVVCTQAPAVTLNQITKESLSAAPEVRVQNKKHDSSVKSLDKQLPILKEWNSALSYSKAKSVDKQLPVVPSKSKILNQNSSKAVASHSKTKTLSKQAVIVPSKKLGESVSSTSELQTKSLHKRPVIVHSKKSSTSMTVTSATEMQAHQMTQDSSSRLKTKAHKQPVGVPSKILSAPSVNTSLRHKSIER